MRSSWLPFGISDAVSAIADICICVPLALAAVSTFLYLHPILRKRGFTGLGWNVYFGVRSQSLTEARVFFDSFQHSVWSNTSMHTFHPSIMYRSAPSCTPSYAAQQNRISIEVTRVLTDCVCGVR
ncbi:hypothetical protein K438DRAFT_1809952 [Mycena galopus ATCC 62051]|nr:hypothetical protein K438DRAFT_1809952 [Mycena galopus ATCC 62051]